MGDSGLEPETPVLSGTAYVQKNEHPQARVISVSLFGYIDPWYREQRLRGVMTTTLDGYKPKIQTLLARYANPDELQVKALLAEKQESGACSGTIANYVKAYRSFFGYLFERKQHHLDPQLFKIPKIHTKERRIPSEPDVQQLLTLDCTDEEKLALLLFVDCGVRVNELATIKLTNIYLDDASITINGKGGKIRTVYLSDVTVTLLRKFMQTVTGEYLFAPRRSDTRTPYRSRHVFLDMLARLCERAGIRRISPHQLRHYFATYALSHGGDIKAVSQMLGHADVGITLKVYHHVNGDDVRRVHRKYSPLRDTTMVA